MPSSNVPSCHYWMRSQNSWIVLRHGWRWRCPRRHGRSRWRSPWALHQVAACNRCVATRTGQEQPIKVFVHPWQQLCPRHGLWRDGRLSRWQYDVSELGDFAQACASHQQLVIRHGFAIAHEAIDLADHVLWQYGHMRAQESAQSARIRRWMETRYPSSPYQLRRDALVRYPATVSLAHIVAGSPRGSAFEQMNAAEHQTLIERVAEHTGGYRPTGWNDRFLSLMRERPVLTDQTWVVEL